MVMERHSAQCDHWLHTCPSVISPGPEHLSRGSVSNCEFIDISSGNGMSEALTLALYMLVCRELGEIPKFPGNRFYYNTVDDNSYAPSLADMSVWAVSNEHTKNEPFNHVNGDTFVWRYLWPKFGRYFGVEVSFQSIS